jgi:hypothetical protein
MCAACTSRPPAGFGRSGVDGEEQERSEQDEVNAALQPGGPTRDHGEDTSGPPETMTVTINATSITVTATARTSDPNGSTTR